MPPVAPPRPNVDSQKAHAVRSTAGVELNGVAWDCKSTDGYMCACKPRRLRGPGASLLKRGGRFGRGGRGGRGERGGRGDRAGRGGGLAVS